MRVETMPGRGPSLADKYEGVEIGALALMDLIDLLHGVRLPASVRRAVVWELRRRTEPRGRGRVFAGVCEELAAAE